MAELIMPMPRIGRTDKETIQNLIDAYIMMRKELEFVMRALDSDNVTEINTNITNVQSDKGTTKIDGPLLIMTDLGKHIRRKEGLDTATGLFTDEWYDENGNRTAYIDSDGKLVVVDGTFTGTITGAAITGGTITGSSIIGGTISIVTDANIGQNLYLGNVSGNVHKGIFFYSDDTPGSITIEGGTMGVTISSKANVTLRPADGCKVDTPSDMNISGNLSVGGTSATIRGNTIATQLWVQSQGYITGTSGATGSFTTADGKTVTVSNGLITSIA